MPDMATIARVPLIRTGSYEASTGHIDFTMEHLQAAVAAFQNDPAVLAPRIHLGHTDERFAEATRDLDGEPALGWFDNLVIDGNTLYGDAHMPAWLAEMAEWAYPSRSVEGWFSYQTPTGHTHDFMLTGVALLGVALPAVATLDDLRELGQEAGAVSIAASAPPVAKMPREVIHAGVAATDLPLRWYAAEADGTLEDLPESYDFWSWYITEIRVDDDGSLFVLAVDDASGRLWRFDATVDGSDVTFAAPTEVVVQYVAAAGRPGPRPRPALASFPNRSASRAFASSPSDHNAEEAEPMNDALRRMLASRHGLDPETATEDEILAAEEAAVAASTEDATEEETEAREVVAATTDNLTVTVSREVWEQTQADARSGAAAREEQIAASRDALVAAAVRDGRITPAERQQWREDMEQSPELVAAQLGRLQKGRVPVDRTEIGGVDASVADNVDDMRAKARAQFNPGARA